jgi:hypothetical protein
MDITNVLTTFFNDDIEDPMRTRWSTCFDGDQTVPALTHDHFLYPVNRFEILALITGNARTSWYI